MCCRIPSLVWLSAGQLDGMNDNVLAQVGQIKYIDILLLCRMMPIICLSIVVDGKWQMCNIEMLGSGQQ